MRSWVFASAAAYIARLRKHKYNHETKIEYNDRGGGMRTRSGGEVDARDGGSASSYKWRPAVHISTLGNQNACAENASFDRSSA